MGCGSLGFPLFFSGGGYQTSFSFALKVAYGSKFKFGAYSGSDSYGIKGKTYRETMGNEGYSDSYSSKCKFGAYSDSDGYGGC